MFNFLYFKEDSLQEISIERQEDLNYWFLFTKFKAIEQGYVRLTGVGLSLGLEILLSY